MPIKFTLETAQEYLVIDSTRLDKEVNTHPALVDRVGMKLARATDRRDTIKSELKRLEAKIALGIRKTAEPKPTETALNHMVIVDSRYVEKNREYLEANLEVGLWEAKREAYRARTSMLKSSSQLFLSGVFGDMAIKSESIEEAAYNTTKLKLKELEKGRRRITNNEEEEDDD